MSVIINFAIFPTDKGESVSPQVSRALSIVKKSGLDHELNPMGTCVEGEWDEVMNVVNSCFKELEKNCSRIYLVMTVDYRKGLASRMRSKIKSVEEKL
jgi:uncharacterized protein (TIGR00106 family)